jgi:outer membrane receptor for monomeric catechols
VNKQVSLRLGGRNLLNTVYLASVRPYGARAGSPRQLLIGLDLGKQ